MAAREKKGLGTGLDVLFGANGLNEENDAELLTSRLYRSWPTPLLNTV